MDLDRIDSVEISREIKDKDEDTRDESNSSLNEISNISNYERKQEIDNKYKWVCCKSKVRPSMIKYLVSVILASTVLMFSMVQIANGQDNQEIYFNIISFILGVFIKPPSLRK